MPVQAGPVKAEPMNASADDEASTASAAYLIALAMLLRCSDSHSMASGFIGSDMPPCLVHDINLHDDGSFFNLRVFIKE